LSSQRKWLSPYNVRRNEGQRLLVRKLIRYAWDVNGQYDELIHWNKADASSSLLVARQGRNAETYTFICNALWMQLNKEKNGNASKYAYTSNSLNASFFTTNSKMPPSGQTIFKRRKFWLYFINVHKRYLFSVSIYFVCFYTARLTERELPTLILWLETVVKEQLLNMQ